MTPAGMGILNEAHAAEIIVFVSRNPGCSKTDLYRGVARGVRMPDKLLMLRDAGILEIVDAGRSTALMLTPRGQAVARCLREIESILSS